MKKILFYSLIFFILASIFDLTAMVYDNRFMPLYQRNFLRTCERRSALMIDGFIMTGDKAFEQEDITDTGIFEIFGQYDENREANALVALGCPNPLEEVPQLRDLVGSPIVWKMDGKIQTQGAAFQFEQHICGPVSTGFSWFFMHLFSRNLFSLPQSTIVTLGLTNEQERLLDDVRRQMNNKIGLLAPKWSVAGFSDIDWYVRVGGLWEYMFKFRRIDAGARAGVMIPSGVVRNPNNPASIPFGGNGLWGIYIAGDFELELKQDWEVGAYVRYNQRFAKTKLQRIVVANEQPLYGAAVGDVRVEPGGTFIFSPFFRFESIREGFGVKGRYTLVYHDDDGFIDERNVRQPPALFSQNIAVSDWIAEYLTVDAFYDFAKVRLPCSFAPVLSAKWDIPMRLFIANGAAKTHRLSLGMIFTF